MKSLREYLDNQSFEQENYDSLRENKTGHDVKRIGKSLYTDTLRSDHSVDYKLPNEPMISGNEVRDYALLKPLKMQNDFKGRLKDSKIGIIVIGKNESANVSKVLEEIERVEQNCPGGFIKLFVDDASSDNTVEKVMERDFTVVSHSDSLGIGGAIRTGYYFFRDLHLDVIVQMDSDGEHPASHIMEMVRTLEERSLDVVIGSRYYNGITPQTSRLKITGVRTISNIFKILAPKYYVADIVSGFRVVRGDSLNKIHFVSDKNWAIEFLLRVVRSKLSIAEIPVPYRYRNHGESQFKSPKSYISYSINIFKQLINSSRKIP